MKDLQDKASCDAKFESALNEAISLFHCIQDKDIELFLHNKATDFSNRGWCSVYLLLNEEQFNAGKIKIEAYFTLSHKSMVADAEHMSNSTIKRYGGMKNATTFDFVLIGQLGKHIDENERSKISGNEILDEAFDVIRQASDLIPCKYALVECSNEKKVRDFYENYNFNFFQKDELNQYTKKI